MDESLRRDCRIRAQPIHFHVDCNQQPRGPYYFPFGSMADLDVAYQCGAKAIQSVLKSTSIIYSIQLLPSLLNQELNYESPTASAIRPRMTWPIKYSQHVWIGRAQGHKLGFIEILSPSGS